MDTVTLRRRFQGLREARGWSQEELAARMGEMDAQTVAAIEDGERAISAEELVAAAHAFGVPVDRFSDQFILVGEGRFSWRQKNADLEALGEFEEFAGRWIAAYRHLSKLRDGTPGPLLPRVGLTEQSSFEDAQALGERVATELDLGPIPAERLSEVLQERLSTVVLYVDTVPGVSGAACQLPELNAILINRNEPVGRRNYDLAHELFHLLTWDAMPPLHVESETPTEKREKRVEQLAENFAAALLMPQVALDPYLRTLADSEIHAWLNRTATALGVSAQALKWRLVNLGILPRPQALKLNEDLLRYNGDASGDLQREVPRPFSRRFLELLRWGLDEGHLSVRRASSLLGISVDGLAGLFSSYEIEVPFEL